MSLCLEDFVDPEKKYAVDNAFIGSDSSSFPPLEDEKSCKPQGYCSERTIGIFKRRRCVVCVYVDGSCLKMALMGRVYNLSEDGVTARVKTIFPCAKRFKLLRGDDVLLLFDYWFLEPKDYWPECDIFPFIELITENADSKRRMLLILCELAAGREITRAEFLARLDKKTD